MLIRAVCISFMLSQFSCIVVLQDGKTALHWAVECCCVEITRRLLNAGIDIEVKDNVK